MLTGCGVDHIDRRSIIRVNPFAIDEVTRLHAASTTTWENPARNKRNVFATTL